MRGTALVVLLCLLSAFATHVLTEQARARSLAADEWCLLADGSVSDAAGDDPCGIADGAAGDDESPNVAPPAAVAVAVPEASIP